MNAGKKLEKKTKIIETAYQQFRNVGIGATAIDDVVKAAGIARGTFYLYFRDKSDLIDQLILYKSAETMKEILLQVRRQRGAAGDNFFAAVRAGLELYVDFLEQHRDILAVLDKNIAACMREFPNFYDEEFREIYGGVLNRFSEAGIPREEATRTIYLVISMIDSVCVDAILFSRPYPLEEIRASALDDAMTIIRSKLRTQEGGANHANIA